MSFFDNVFRADYKSIIDFFGLFNWRLTFPSSDANDSRVVLLTPFTPVLSFVPQVTPRPSTFPAWPTPEIKNIVFLKKIVLTLNTNPLDFLELSTFLSSPCFLCKKCYGYLISRTESSIALNLRYLWFFVRKYRSSPPILSRVIFNGETSFNSTNVANLFLNTFPLFVPPHCLPPLLRPRIYPLIPFSRFMSKSPLTISLTTWSLSVTLGQSDLMVSRTIFFSNLLTFLHGFYLSFSINPFKLTFPPLSLNSVYYSYS